MKRASYRAAIRWIVDNDDTSDVIPEAEDGNHLQTVTMALVADLFDVPDSRVWDDVLRLKAALDD